MPPTAPPTRVPRPANVGMQAGARAADAREAESAYAKAGQHVPPDVELDSAPDDNAPALTPDEIAALQARLNRARGMPPAGGGSGGAAGATGAAAAAAAGAKGAAGAAGGASGAGTGGAGGVAGAAGARQGGPAGAAASASGPAGKAPPAGGARPQGGPPLREPIGLGTWLLVAMILALIWYLAKPANKEERIAARVGQAEKYAAECKLEDARAELATLRSDKAPAAQIRRVNEAISGAAPACEKKRQRAKAWSDLKPALDSALEKAPPGGALDTADSRLSAFTKKWGADDETRELDKRIDGKKAERLLDDADACLQRSDRACLEAKLVAAERFKRPELEERIRTLRESLSRLLEATMLEQKAPQAAAPATLPPAIASQPPRAASPVISTVPQTAQTAQQARKILADAEREFNQGNYKGAMDKAEICATMIDVGNRECLGLKQRAERLNRDMLRCVASGADWINDRCQ
ncbi:hypothetical protein ASC94_07455 [Massilia sp. Root418]|nr:hypothetical protein ASC94_07455 [Massilia sp. Root418]